MKKKNDCFVKKKYVNIINLIYRAWLETDEYIGAQAQSEAYNKLLESLNAKQAKEFKQFADLCADFRTQREIQLICFVLEIVKQINNLPKSEEI